ncbi:unnamed protein product [Gadus morhua 'NCC']
MSLSITPAGSLPSLPAARPRSLLSGSLAPGGGRVQPGVEVEVEEVVEVVEYSSALRGHSVPSAAMR